MKEKDKIEGEGSYTGTKDYNERTKQFIDSGKVQQAANDAIPPLLNLAPLKAVRNVECFSDALRLRRVLARLRSNHIPSPLLLARIIAPGPYDHRQSVNGQPDGDSEN